MTNNKDNRQFDIKPYDLEAQQLSNYIRSIEQEPTEEVHLIDYIHILLKRKWIIFFFFIAVIIATAILTFTIIPQYKSKVIIQIEEENTRILNIAGVKFEERTGPNYYETQYEILKSRSLANKVIEKLNLDKNEDFIPIESKLSTIKNRIIANLLSFIEFGGLEEIRSDSLGKKELFEHNFDKEDKRMQYLIDILIEGLEVNPIKNSHLVNVSFVSHSPKIAYEVANAIGETYIDFILQSKIIATQQAREWLQDQIEIMKKNIENTEEKLNQYSVENKILINDVDSNNLLTEELKELSSSLMKVNTERIQKDILYKQITELGSNNSIILNNPLILELKENYATLEAEYFNLSKIYKPDYPKMESLKSQMDTILMRINKEKSNIINSMEYDYKATVKKEAHFNSLLENLKNKIHDFQDKRIQYQMLKREVDTNNALYNNMLQRLKEISVYANTTTTNIQILDKAVFPKTPFKPNKLQNILLAIIFGLMGGTGLVLLMEYLDNTVKDTKEVEKKIQLPAIGIIPTMRMIPFEKNSNSSKMKLTKYSGKTDPITEVFRFISTYMSLSSVSKLPKTILIASPGEGEGKTTVCINTATVFAESIGKGLIIDADLRKPQLHNIFNIDNSNGLSTFLSGNIGLEIIKPTSIKNLDVITSGPTLHNPPMLLGSTRMKELINVLYPIYDFIIIDSAPILGLSDSIYLSTLVEGVILVVKAGKTHRDALKETKNILQNINTNIIGVVLNGVNKDDLRYSCHSY